MSPAWDGMLLVDKPTGPTSHDVVDLVRRATGQRRVGHTGTLDPLASGLLPILLGRATRLARFLPRSPKSYTGRLRLGLTTLSDDLSGPELSRHTGSLPDHAHVLRAAEELVGTSTQRPPTISARKVGGERLYRLARRGVPVRGEPRPVEVTTFELRPVEDDPALYEFLAVVSGGTYIRSLVRDLGAMLGCGGILVGLRREAIGPMAPDPALCLSSEGIPDAGELRPRLVPLDALPLEPPRLVLDAPEQARRFASGVAQPTSAALPDGPCVVFDAQGRLLGVALKTADLVRPRVVLAVSPG